MPLRLGGLLSNSTQSLVPQAASAAGPWCTPQQFYPGVWRALADETPTRPTWPCCGIRGHNFLRNIAQCGSEPMARVNHAYTGNDEFYAHYGGHGCQCNDDGDSVWAAEWLPEGCSLIPLTPVSFCEILGDRTLLVIGDSTMEQTASSLMNAAHGVCGTQISLGPSDTLIGENMGVLNRGKEWTYWVRKQGPDIVLLGAGAHVHEGFERLLHTVASQYEAHCRSGAEKCPLLVWKTQFPGGCTREALSEPINYENYTGPGDPAGLWWDTYWDRDVMASAYMASRGISVLDVRALYLRSDAHPASGDRKDKAADCLHFCCDSEGPLYILPQLFHHLLWWLQQQEQQGR